MQRLKRFLFLIFSFSLLFLFLFFNKKIITSTSISTSIQNKNSLILNSEKLNLETIKSCNCCSNFINSTVLNITTFKSSFNTNYPRILVLTPIKSVNYAEMQRYGNLLKDLNFPKQNIDVAMLESDSRDSSTTYNNARKLGDFLLLNGFHSFLLLQHDFNYYINVHTRHDINFQVKRRAILARSRNMLLYSALKLEHNWVLWIDVDLYFYPNFILNQLLEANKQIIVPNCVMEPGGRSYDLNTWKGGDPELIRRNWGNDIIFEGYKENGRKHLSDLRKDGSITQIDSVGGAMLLVDADLHRQGLIFPFFGYRQHIETEGFALMAADIGINIWGMPNLEIIHH
eukprot:TRINITY_DN1386_c2_g2_i1.p1 TRINITY_DN1386_c2_g2~~TRINITY_DN1386_c2_g2_i1.p1  ORF type:complete len:342 (-),score=101.37 TRINITY_DN1386_c2_g2_i1:127-1152(-)